MCEHEPRLSGLICVISSQSHRLLGRLWLQARGKAKGKPPPKEKCAHTHAKTEVTGNSITSTNCVPEGSGGICWWDVPFSPPPSFSQRQKNNMIATKQKSRVKVYSAISPQISQGLAGLCTIQGRQVEGIITGLCSPPLPGVTQPWWHPASSSVTLKPRQGCPKCPQQPGAGKGHAPCPGEGRRVLSRMGTLLQAAWAQAGKLHIRTPPAQQCAARCSVHS